MCSFLEVLHQGHVPFPLDGFSRRDFKAALSRMMAVEGVGRAPIQRQESLS